VKWSTILKNINPIWYALPLLRFFFYLFYSNWISIIKFLWISQSINQSTLFSFVHIIQEDYVILLGLCYFYYWISILIEFHFSILNSNIWTFIFSQKMESYSWIVMANKNWCFRNIDVYLLKHQCFKIDFCCMIYISNIDVVIQKHRFSPLLSYEHLIGQFLLNLNRKWIFFTYNIFILNVILH
jgi:hypothetical protein